MSKHRVETWRDVPAPDPLNPSGYVYFIHSPSLNLIKIGFTAKYPDARFRDHKVSSPDIVPMGYIRGRHQDEQSHHRKFDRLRHSGEWFRADPELLDYIRDHAEPWAIDPTEFRARHADRELPTAEQKQEKFAEFLEWAMRLRHKPDGAMRLVAIALRDGFDRNELYQAVQSLRTREKFAKYLKAAQRKTRASKPSVVIGVAHPAMRNQNFLSRDASTN